MYGFEYAFTPNDVLDVSYLGGRGSRITLGGMNYDQLNPTYLSMGSALGKLGGHQSVCRAVGQPWTDSYGLPVDGRAILVAVSGVLRRCLSHRRTVGKQRLQRIAGQFQASFRRRPDLYRLLHFLEVPVRRGRAGGMGISQWRYGGSGIRNYYDLKADWTVDGEDIPQSLVLNYVYELPFGRGKTVRRRHEQG